MSFDLRSSLRTGAWAPFLLLAAAPSCSNETDETTTQDLTPQYVACNAASQQFTQSFETLEQGVLSSMLALNNEDYDTYTTYWTSTFEQQLGACIQQAEELDAALTGLSGALGSQSSATQMPSTLLPRSEPIGTVRQPILPAIILGGLTIAGATLAIREFDKKMRSLITNSDKTTEESIELRTQKYIAAGNAKDEARKLATRDVASVATTEYGIPLVKEMATVIATKGFEEAAEAAVGVHPVGRGIVAVKDAWELGTALGTSGDCTPPETRSLDGYRPMDASMCRIFIGKTSNATFDPFPTGTWNVFATGEGWEPGAEEGVVVIEGQTTFIDGSGWKSLSSGQPAGPGECGAVTLEQVDVISINPIRETGTTSTDQVRVYADASCCWRASTNADWARIEIREGEQKGDLVCGNGRIHLIVPCNCSGQRTATVKVGDRTFQVEQAAAPDGPVGSHCHLGVCP
jgi:hypothetical protein